MSLFLTKLFDQKAISEMYDLAGTFADIRERATIEKIRPANTEEKKFDKLVKLKADYVKATAKSDKYLGSRPVRTDCPPEESLCQLSARVYRSRQLRT